MLQLSLIYHIPINIFVVYLKKLSTNKSDQYYIFDKNLRTFTFKLLTVNKHTKLKKLKN